MSSLEKKFKKQQEKIQTAKKKFHESERELVLAKTKYDKLKKKRPAKYEAMTDKMAALEAEEDGVSEKDVEEAQREYERLEDKIDEAKKNLSVKEKVKPKRASQLQQIRDEFLPVARKYYKQQAQPLINEMLVILDSIEELQDEKMKPLRKEIEGYNGLSASTYLGPEIERIKLNHLKKLFKIESYRKKLKRDFLQTD